MDFDLCQKNFNTAIRIYEHYFVIKLFIHRKYRLMYKRMNVLEPDDKPKWLNNSVVSNRYPIGNIRGGILEGIPVYQVLKGVSGKKISKVGEISLSSASRVLCHNHTS